MNQRRTIPLGSRLRIAAAGLLLAGAAAAQAPERAELRVRAVDAQSGAPVPGLMVVACAGSIGRVWAFARTDAHGTALLGALPLGDYLVATERRAPYAVTCGGVQLEEAAGAELTLALGGGRRVSGVVLDHGGAAVEGAEILWDPPFFPDRPTAAYHYRPPLVVGRSGADGRFTIDHLGEFPTRLAGDGGDPDSDRSATIRLQARTPALESARMLPAALAAPGASELKGPIVVRPVALRAAGVVRRDDGHPAAGVLVTANLARIDACSAGLDFGRHEADDPFAHPPLFWEPGFELRAGEAITDERGRFELTVHEDGAHYFRGPWNGRVCAVDQTARVTRALTWGGRDAQQAEDLHLVLPSGAPAYFRFMQPDGSSVARSPRDSSIRPSAAYLPLDDSTQETTLLRTGDRPKGGAVIDLVLADGRTVRSNRTGWHDGLCWIATDAPLAEVRALRTSVEGLQPIDELEVNGLEVGRALEVRARPLSSVRLSLSPSAGSTAAQLDGTRWIAWACLAAPERRAEHEPHGPWWRRLVNSERVEAGCCGLGTRHRTEWRGARLRLDVPVQVDAPYWIYVGRQPEPRLAFAGVEVFGPFEPGDETHELTLGTGASPPRSPDVTYVPTPGTAAPEGRVYVRAVDADSAIGADSGADLGRVDVALRWSGGEVVPRGTSSGDDGRVWLDLGHVLSRGARGSGVPTEVVALERRGYDPAPIGVALTPGPGDLDLGTVRMTARPPFRARLVRADGGPLMGTPAIGNRLGISCGGASARPDHDDTIEVLPGPPAAFVLEVHQRDAGVTRYWAIDVPAWDADEVREVELPKTRPVELRVRGVGPVQRYAALRVGVEPLSELSASARRRPAWWGDPFGPSIERGGGAPDARSFFLELAPGRYRFTWRGVLFDFEETKFVVVPGSGTQVVKLWTR